MQWEEKYKLVGFQLLAVRCVLEEWASRNHDAARRLLLIAATGAGKTIMCARIIFKCVGWGKKVLFICDSEELVNQTVRKLYETCGIIAGVEQEKRRACTTDQVVVASIQSIGRPERLRRFTPDSFDVVIVDEAHLSLAASWLKVMKHFNEARVLGVTATPSRGDRQNLLKKFWDKIVYNISMFDLIDMGSLVPVRVEQFPIEMDLDGVEIAMEDDQTSLAEAMRPLHDKIIDEWAERAKGRKTLWFQPSRASSRAFASRLNERGFTACHIDGDSPDRKETLRYYTMGRYDSLTNAILLIKGYDEPAISCIVPLRGFKTKTPFIQAIGRGTRLHCSGGCRDYHKCSCDDKKKDLLVLDVFGAYPKLGVMTAADLAGDDPEQVAAIKRAIAKKDGPIDIQELAIIVAGEREQSFVLELKKAKRWNKKMVYDARQVSAALGNHELFDFDPGSVGRFGRGGITSGQAVNLANMGIDPRTVHNSGHAVAMLDAMFKARRSMMATPQQMAEMVKRGIKFTPGKTTSNEAETLIKK